MTLINRALCVFVLFTALAGAWAGDSASPASPPLLRGPITGVAVDAAGNRYVTGTFTATQDFDPRPGSADIKAGVGGDDVFITRIDADGT